ncbi:MAG TPA: hypothetical protein VFR03_08550 [Thermoanaerobaculia bacterium]|nr:hypothetical protein [Thermoanaerobaculia bacterium]
MAQRVYLLPVEPRIVELLSAAILEDPGPALAELRAGSQAHAATASASKRAVARLDEDRFKASGRGDDYALYSALRPYCVTETSAAAAADAIDALLAAGDEVKRQTLLEDQLRRLDPSLLAASAGVSRFVDDTAEQWAGLKADVGTLRRMREAALAGRTYEHEFQRREEEDGGEDDEPQTFEGAALAEIYGQLLGTTFGRLLGLSLPSWWMGRDFWVGLLLAAELSPFQLFARRVRKRLTQRAESPAGLFSGVAVPGFEAGFPLVCEAYGTGLYLPPAAVRELLPMLEGSRKAFVSLGAKASGYERGIVEQIAGIIHEAFLWAARHGLGLLEGDELVGAYGYR